MSLLATVLLIALSLKIYEFITQGRAGQLYTKFWDFLETKKRPKALASVKTSPPASLGASTQLSRQRRSSASAPVAATAVSEKRTVRRRLDALRPRRKGRDEEKGET